MLTKIATEAAPRAIGPYSQGVCTGNLLFVSGQIPIHPETGEITGNTIQTQTHQACKNLAAVLEGAGTDMTKVIKTTCFLADMGDFAAFNEVYATYFTGNPARSCVAVAALPKGVLVEIEAVAER